MEMACPGAPGSAVGQQKELAKAKEKTQAMGKKQSSINKLEAVEKSPVFCGKWEILNDVITKGTAKEGSEGGQAAISIIAQAECKGPRVGGYWQRGQMGGPAGGCSPCERVAGTREARGPPMEEGGQGDQSMRFSQDTTGGVKLRKSGNCAGE